MAFLSLPGWDCCVFNPVMRPFLSLVRVPQQACKQETTLLAQVECLLGRLRQNGCRAGSPGNSLFLTYKQEKTEQVPSPLWNSISLSNEGLDWNDLQFLFSANVISRIFAVLYHRASALS